MLFAKDRGKKISYNYICPKVLKMSYIIYRLFFFPHYLIAVFLCPLLNFFYVILVLCYLVLTEIKHVTHLSIHFFVCLFIRSLILFC